MPHHLYDRMITDPREMRRAIAWCERALRDNDRIKFDALVGTGISGACMVPALSAKVGCFWSILRKTGDDSHQREGIIRYPDSRMTRAIIVDDFVCSGATVCRIIKAYAAIDCSIVGVLLYGIQHKNRRDCIGYYGPSLPDGVPLLLPKRL
jgi:adenine/guanine phosphoribosyltransferase-like PRPP-binding protein